ncbi:MAG: two-component system sensor histidine kinase KdbD [Burkholderiales bacterium PBB1]|nr:MAG: two-component system sensor histidine kinase KdbD [Burkholderiales bacterium PBB1]
MTTEPQRPDPDALLAQLRDAQQREGRGKLRIYFGASAGVGKTCAMLEAAQQLKADGVDVVAGVVETHGRSHTAALLEGLPVLPAAQIEYRGKRLAEFDLDGALARRPALLLVDELAHSNVPGSRHPKRWQDVEELLAAGIDVYSTLNVQHLESLNDVVGGITGIAVHETLPDTFFDSAAEVVLVDTPADELIERLAAGKVYLPAQAERAAKNFFRKGNLMALRELALRRTADRVEDDVQAWRSDRRITQVWQTEGALLCGIGPHEGAEHVVRSTARLAQQLAVSWHAVYVETPALQRLAPAHRERILQTVKLAEALGARSVVLSAQSVAQALVAHARANNLSKLVLGTAQRHRGWPMRTLAEAIARRAPDIDRIEVGQPEATRQRTSPQATTELATPEGSAQIRRYLLAAGTCAATTLLTHLLVPYFDLANIVMVFLLAVVGIGVWLGRGPAVLAAFMNVASFDFFFVPPRGTFAVSDAQYLLTFAIMLIVGLVTGQLTAGLRFQASVATHREARSRALFEAARDLSNMLTREQVIEVARAVIGREFRAQVAIYVLDANDRLQAPTAAPGEPAQQGLDTGTAQWSIDHLLPAGLGTDTLAGSAWLYLPLKATMRARGVLAVRPEVTRFLLIPEQRQQLETFTALTAMALERVHYIEVAQAATVQMESERLRNSLLSALSHDLRTPLAALVGLAETLAGSQPALSADQQALARSMADKTQRMTAMVTNLLDMARIQSGEIRLRVEWHSLEEIIGSALKAAQGSLGSRRISVHIAPAVPLVECDAVLIERVLANLLENAGKYTPVGSPLEIIVLPDGPVVRVCVQDHGPGVPTGQEDAIFDKFTRGHTESATPGMGLGLAICRAIIEAHRGHIGVEPTRTEGQDHGATFSFTLPLGTPPAIDLTELPDSLQSPKT